MNVYEINDVKRLLSGNPYAGRGIIIGKSEDGKSAAICYFIMGRSENSRNRIFKEEGEDVTIYPFDESKVEDPSLIIYSPIRRFKNKVIVTNGDQTDTIYDGLEKGQTFSKALESREFEPDSPNYTPRISGIVDLEGGFKYSMSILKSADEKGSACNRFTYDYAPLSGLGHFIHTYVTDGNPLPTFQGEPERVAIPNSADELAESVWNSLNKDNRISLYCRFIDLSSGICENVMINKHSK